MVRQKDFIMGGKERQPQHRQKPPDLRIIARNDEPVVSEESLKTHARAIVESVFGLFETFDEASEDALRLLQHRIDKLSPQEHKAVLKFIFGTDQQSNNDPSSPPPPSA